MCDTPSHGILFCRCAVPADDPRPLWTLRRYHSHDWADLEIGRCLQLHYPAQTQDFADQLIAALNHAPQFDFASPPAEGDVLNVKPGAGSLHNIIELEFTAGQWRQQNQDSNHLNRKLTISSGVIKQL